MITTKNNYRFMKNMLKHIICPLVLIITLLPGAILAASRTNIEDWEVKAIEFRSSIGQKLQPKIDEVFINIPTLLEIYNKTQNTELSTIRNLPEYQNLLSSTELKVLNHSPEMQEAVKVAINEISTLIVTINQQIAGITSQVNNLEQKNISASEIKRNIYAREGLIRGMKVGINDAIQLLNQQKQLYFTDPSFAKSVSDFTPIQKPDTLTTDSILNALINLDQIIDTRMTSITLDNYVVSAGDEITGEDEIWIKGIKSYAKQSQYQMVQGYKLDQQGVVFGLNLIDNYVGLAYAFIQDNGKSDNTKERINNHIGGLSVNLRFFRNWLR